MGGVAMVVGGGEGVQLGLRVSGQDVAGVTVQWPSGGSDEFALVDPGRHRCRKAVWKTGRWGMRRPVATERLRCSMPSIVEFNPGTTANPYVWHPHTPSEVDRACVWDRGSDPDR